MMVARHYVTDKLACGQDAAIDMWGKTANENNEVFIMKMQLIRIYLSLMKRKEINLERH